MQETCPVLTLPRLAEDLSCCVSNQLLKNFRYYQRRAERLGSVYLDCAGQKTSKSC
jgi:hypothetical protein